MAVQTSVWHAAIETQMRTSTHPPTHPPTRLQGNCGRVMVVLITDGRANISLARSNGVPDALKPDALKPSFEELKVRCHFDFVHGLRSKFYILLLSSAQSDALKPDAHKPSYEELKVRHFNLCMQCSNCVKVSAISHLMP